MKSSTFLVIVAALTLSACGYKASEEPESIERTGNFHVARLFTHDGCTVYRFRDRGDSRYFTKCIDGPSSAAWDERYGKGLRRPVENTTILERK